MEDKNMTRTPIPINTERKLWAESFGHCTNPGCGTELFKGGKKNADLAHIVPYAQTKDNSFENLVAVCPNCHRSADTSGNQEEILREWKNNQYETIRRIMETKYESFEAMSKVVRPILERNKFMYENYYENADTSEHWELFEPEILANNEKLLHIFEANMKLFQGTVDYYDSNTIIAHKFIGHVKEFKETRGKTISRIVLFPEEINSIFGVSPVETNYEGNEDASSLQNLVRYLVKEKRFIKLDLGSTPPTLCYSENNKFIELRLNDRPRVEQVYWNTRSYSPKTSEIRLRNLTFFTRWLNTRGFTFSFPDITDFSHIKINGKYNIRLAFKYSLSGADVHRLCPPKGFYIVNLHHFMRSDCISDEARDLEHVFQVKILSGIEFYKYARKHLANP